MFTLFIFIGFLPNVFGVYRIILVVIKKFRMPSTTQNRKKERKDRYRNKVSTECGSGKIIPNCPLQGKKEIIGIHGTLRRSRTYPEYSGRVGSNESGPKEKGLHRSFSMNWPQFWPQKFAKPIPVIGCENCTPWVVCKEHMEWMTKRFIQIVIL